jgi:stearoyl-CoA desaturase (delta-9 desaturase)
MKANHSILNTVKLWFDSEHGSQNVSDNRDFNWMRCLPFIMVHFACLAVIWVGWSTTAVIVCAALYLVRMFAITAFYHRYFSHKSFKTNRVWQFVFAVLGNSATQRGPLWWAAHHRKHHKHSDEEADLHSPVKHGFWWSHMGWFTCDAAFKTDYSMVKEWAKFPELRFLNRFDILVPIILGVSLFGIGEALYYFSPQLETSGAQLFIWGYCISTVLLAHGTFTVNSLNHTWGKRRFKTSDDSRNNIWLAIITLGEGWHNNHHRFPVSARQGFYWWEVDVSYYLLNLMSKLGIIWDLNPVPSRILKEGLDPAMQASASASKFKRGVSHD